MQRLKIVYKSLYSASAQINITLTENKKQFLMYFYVKKLFQ